MNLGEKILSSPLSSDFRWFNREEKFIHLAAVHQLITGPRARAPCAPGHIYTYSLDELMGEGPAAGNPRGSETSAEQKRGRSLLSSEQEAD